MPESVQTDDREDFDYPPTVLLNEGVPVTLGGEQRRVRFTNAVLCKIEATWGSVAAWQQANQDTPATHLRDTLAVMFDLTPDEVSGMLDAPGAPNWKQYSEACGIAYAIANGVDPTQAVSYILAARQQGLTPEQVKLIETLSADLEPASS